MARTSGSLIRKSFETFTRLNKSLSEKSKRSWNATTVSQNSRQSLSLNAAEGSQLISNRVSIYETKLRDSLQMRKNLKKTDWPIIIHHVNERARRENKESDVYRYGVLIPKKTLGKEFHRHRQSVADLSSCQ